ncbi:MAG: type II toxin-antitoxin system RelE/ParE family toxin [Bacteroidota bacterium]
MSYSVIFSSKAADEALEQAIYLENQRPGYGQIFNQSLKSAVELLAVHPQRFATTLERPDIHRVHLAPPFNKTHSLYYKFDGTTVRVVCVFPNRRDPKIWQNR